MNEQLPYRAIVPSAPKDTPRPLWSVMIPTYNCAAYLRETLASVLAQDPGPEVMQIEVVDDCSTKDDPASVVEELGQGRVKFYRQPQNVGHIQNFQTCLEHAQGHLVHLLHGDDCVRDGFYQKIQQVFETSPEIGAAFCRHIHMDEKGHWHYISHLEQSKSGVLSNWLEQISVRQRIQTPSMVVRRDVYEKLGGFDRRLSWTEDWEMWVRIAAHYPVGYEVEPLALYRQHSNSSSGRKVQTGEDIQDLRRAIFIMGDYLPTESAKELSRYARRNYAVYALNAARGFAFQNNAKAAINQLKEGLRCYLSPSIFQTSLNLLLYIIYKQLRFRLKHSKF
jgi:glycosyltransferase involved in cell wall biosynthesis